MYSADGKIKISSAVNDWERVSADDNMDRRDLAKSRGTLSGSIWFLCRHAWRLPKLPRCERAQEYRHKYSLNRCLNSYIISVPFSPRQVLYNNQALVRKPALSKVTFPVLLKLISCVYVVCISDRSYQKPAEVRLNTLDACLNLHQFFPSVDLNLNETNRTTIGLWSNETLGI